MSTFNRTTDKQPSSRSTVHDHPTLLHLAQTSQILFRVTDSTSISPLYWTGNPSTSGFSSPNLNLAYLAPTTYASIFTPSSILGEGPYLRHTVLDHVMGKEKQTCLPTLTSIDERPDTPEDEKTPWISTSVDLDWVIYEVCRRLVALRRKSVWVTVIAYPIAGVSPRVVGQEDVDVNVSGRKGVEVLINPVHILRMPHPRAKDLMLSVTMKENYDLSRKSSEVSSERLIWGRVFAESILHHTEFTLDFVPMDLPGRLFRPGVRRSGRGWTRGLVWDPRVDAYEIARTRMRERQEQIDGER